ncbi:MAG: hypothetical protein JWP44_284 [Mucilaginibacter sp.]|nr:hypothetical protein [Mucilaginibacter sp.]
MSAKPAIHTKYQYVLFSALLKLKLLAYLLRYFAINQA